MQKKFTWKELFSCLTRYLPNSIPIHIELAGVNTTGIQLFQQQTNTSHCNAKQAGLYIYVGRMHVTAVQFLARASRGRLLPSRSKFYTSHCRRLG